MITVDEKSIVDLYNNLQRLFDTTTRGIRGSLYWGNSTSSAFPREAAKGFAKFLSDVISGDASESTGLKSRLRVLNPDYLKWKKEKGYNLNKWIATGNLSRNIISTDTGSNVATVSVDPSAVSTTGDIPERLATVVQWIERGNTTLNIPPRPLWALTVEMFKAGKLVRFEKAVDTSIAKYIDDSASLFRKSKSSLGDIANADVSGDFSVSSLEKAANGSFGSDTREQEMVNSAVKKAF